MTDNETHQHDDRRADHIPDVTCNIKIASFDFLNFLKRQNTK